MLGDYDAIRGTYDRDAYLADMVGLHLVGSVAVESAADDPLVETRWLEEQAAAGIPSAVVVGCRLELPTVREDLTAHLRASPRVRGVRQMLNWHALPHLRSAQRDGLMSDPAWRRGLALVGELDLSFDLQVFPHQVAEAAELAGAFPRVRFVLDHGGLLATGSADDRAARSRGLRALAALPNVFVKLSGFGINNPDRGESAFRAWFAELLDAFGASRAMLGSDYPVDKLHHPENPLRRLCELSSELTADEDADLRIGTATRVYRLQPAT